MMLLSKKRQAEWMRNYRKSVIPKSDDVIPEDRLSAHIEYKQFDNIPLITPQASNALNEKIDRDLLSIVQSNYTPYTGSIKPLPNCPDGRYREKP